VKYLIEMFERKRETGPVFTAGLLWLGVVFVLALKRLPAEWSAVERGSLLDAVATLAELGPVMAGILIAAAAWFLGELYAVVVRLVRAFFVAPSGDLGLGESELELVKRVSYAAEGNQAFHQLLLDRWREERSKDKIHAERLKRQAWLSPPAGCLCFVAWLKFEVITWWMLLVLGIALTAIFLGFFAEFEQSRHRLQERFDEATSRKPNSPKSNRPR